MITRRDFLELAGRGALWATLGASIVALMRFLGFAEPEPPQVFTLDMPDVYPPGAFTPVADGRAFIGHDAGGLYAIAARCTHLGCLSQRRSEGFECPCHGSRFDATGAVTRGPAERPLGRVALTIGPKGQVVLDLRQTVEIGYRLTIDERGSP